MKKEDKATIKSRVRSLLSWYSELKQEAKAKKFSESLDAMALELDIEKGVITNLTNGSIIQIEPLPPVMIKLLEDGGLVEHIKKNGDFKLTD